MNSNEVRQKYLKFFEKKGHVILPSASLLPENDPSTLFTSSGMQPLIPYLMGESHPEGSRLVDSQKSFRSGDIEEVGDSRHSTFFEMLGNWSLGDYFKKEQLNWLFEFLTKEINLDPNRLYVTVYRGNPAIGIDRDNESVDIWKSIFNDIGITALEADMAEERGIKEGERIFYYGDEKNWWSRSGPPANMPLGEIGGPDSEVFYDLGSEFKKHENSEWKDLPCHVNCDCGRFIEISNSVFIEFIKTEKGFEKLPQKNVDFGGGLERLTMVSQGKNTIFETDLYKNIISKIEMLSGKKYYDNSKAFEIIADHLKAATFLIGDDKGIVPSNTDQGYIIRRLIRRAIRYGRQLDIISGSSGLEEGWTKEIAKIVIHDYHEVYPELRRNVDFIIDAIKEEEMKFIKTLEKGLLQLEKLNKEALNKGEQLTITGKGGFDLYQTYGFPREMIEEEIGKFSGKIIEKEGFDLELKKHQELSRTAAAGKFKGGLADQSEETTKLHTAAHLLLAALRKVLGDHVIQKGSNITSERLRFDFSHPEKLSDEQKEKVEKLVNEAIEKDLPIACDELALEEANKRGAMGVFESRYGEKVKVFKIGENEQIFSYEICGGPHVEKTGLLGEFKIKKEQSSSSGVRRIKAVLLKKE